MLSPADLLLIGTAALLFFGPDQLPKVARKAGQVVRDVQATSASFIREMERAADEPEPHARYGPSEPYAPAPYASDLETVPFAPAVKAPHEVVIEPARSADTLEPPPKG